MVRFPPAEMSPGEIPEDIQPFTDPRYWGGEVLGDDSGQAPEPPTGRKSGKLAVDMMAILVRQGSDQRGLTVFERPQPYKPGQSFSAQEQYIGTLVLLRKEELVRAGSLIPYPDMSELESGEKPPRPQTGLGIDLSTPALERSMADRVSGAGLIYTSAVHLGVVTMDSDQSKRLFTIPHGRISRNPGSQHAEVATVWGSTAEPDPLTVGEVRHYSGRKWDDERLVRVTALTSNPLTEAL